MGSPLIGQPTVKHFWRQRVSSVSPNMQEAGGLGSCPICKKPAEVALCDRPGETGRFYKGAIQGGTVAGDTPG